MKKVSHLPATLAVAIALSVASSAAAQKLAYPQTKKVDQVDIFFGVKVEDPYRWLEEENSPETAQWVEAENKVTSAYLEKIPYRDALKARLSRLQNYARYSAPSRKGANYIFSKNDGLQNQSVLYIQQGLDGTPEVLLDPNKFSVDGTTRLAGFAPSKNGKYAVVGKSIGGSDWRTYFVMDMTTLKYLPDSLNGQIIIQRKIMQQKLLPPVSQVYLPKTLKVYL